MSQGLAISLFVLASYLLVAAGVQNIYPFSVFPMFSNDRAAEGSRFIAIVDGKPREISDFVSWTCPEEIPQFGKLVCPDGQLGTPSSYLVKEATDHISAHTAEEPSQGAVSVSLVVRRWDLRPNADDTPRDCPLMECVAVER